MRCRNAPAAFAISDAPSSETHSFTLLVAALSPLLYDSHPGTPQARAHLAQWTRQDLLRLHEPMTLHEFRCELASRIGVTQSCENRLTMGDVNPMRPAVARVSNVELSAHERPFRDFAQDEERFLCRAALRPIRRERVTVSPRLEVTRQHVPIGKNDFVRHRIDARHVLEITIGESLIVFAPAKQESVSCCDGQCLHATHVEGSALFARDLRETAPGSGHPQTVRQDLSDFRRRAAFEEPGVAYKQKPVAELVLLPMRFLFLAPRQRLHRLADDFGFAQEATSAEFGPRMDIELLDLIPKRNHDQRVDAARAIVRALRRCPRAPCFVVSRLVDQPAT